MNRHLMRIWNEVVKDNPDKDEQWQMNATLEIYNNTYPNDGATMSDLIYALEHHGDR